MAPGGAGARDETVAPGARVGADDATIVPGAGDDATIAAGGAGPGGAAPWSRAGMPGRIGKFRIVRVLAQGGMGTVFEAEQDQPKRTVALKVIRAGLASPSALRRFEYESQVLARLQHPGIAQVYEAGTHDDGEGGVPYFVMEFVPEARILSEYAEVHHLGTDERLELFIQVCDAVHHGHQKGVIHRDLKPGNILVATSGQPKIIDFGIARATDADTQTATLQTQVGELVGTVQYMSPEQVEADPNDIDTRSDVYALGVVLYELLTGRLPYDVSSVPIFEATRVIREKPPTPLAPIRSELKGDIETIVLKALEKERDRRYQSAAEFAADIRRFLKQEPILARPPSTLYQFRKFASRNKALVGGIVAVLLTLVAGLVGTTWAMVEARRNAATAWKTTGELQKVFMSLDAIEGAGPDLRVRDMLDRAVTDLGLEDEPEMRAAIQWSFGQGYRAITMWEQAETQLREALETRRRVLDAPDPDLAQSIFDYGAVLYAMQRNAEAEAHFREALEMRTELYGEVNEDVANAHNYLAAALVRLQRWKDAERHYARSLELRKKIAERECADTAGAPDPCVAARDRVARTLNNMAFMYMRRYRADDASPEAAKRAYLHDAERMFREAVDEVRSLRGPRDVLVAGGLNNLARCLAERDDRLEEARRMFAEALSIKLEGYGPDHTSTATTRHYYAEVLQRLGALDEAEAEATESLRVRLLRYEPGQKEIGETLDLLAGIQEAREAWPAAVETLRALLEHRRLENREGGGPVEDAERRLRRALDRVG